MCKSFNDYLGWNPGDEVVEIKTMVEDSLAIMKLIRNVFVSLACLPTSFTNSGHMDLMDLKAKGKLTRNDSTNLHISGTVHPITKPLLLQLASGIIC